MFFTLLYIEKFHILLHLADTEQSVSSLPPQTSLGNLVQQEIILVY